MGQVTKGTSDRKAPLMPQRLDPATKERVLSLMRERLRSHANLTEAAAAAARREGLHKETAYRWAQQAGLDETCPPSLDVFSNRADGDEALAGLALENRELRLQLETLQTAIRLLGLTPRPVGR